MLKKNLLKDTTIVLVLLCLYLLINFLTGCGHKLQSPSPKTPTPKATVKITPKPTVRITPKPTCKITPKSTPTPTLKPSLTASLTPTPTFTPVPTATPAPTPLMEWYKYRQDKEMSGRSKGSATMLNAPLLNMSYDIAGWQGYLIVKESPGYYDHKVLPYQTMIDPNFYESNKYQWKLGEPRYDLYGTGILVPIADGPSYKIADILTDRPGLEKVIVDSYYGAGDNARARLYSYNNGKEQLVWTSEAFPTCYGPVVCCADADNNGQLDIIISMHYRLVVINGATGVTMMNLAYMDHRNYGFLGIADIDDDPYPEFCVISDFAQHIEVIDNNGQNLSLKWYKQIEENIVLNNRITRPCVDSFSDIDNDGKVEVICNIFNYNDDHHWDILIFDALNGSVKYKLNNCYLHSLKDVNNDGYKEIFVTTTTGREVPTYGELRIYKVIPNFGIQKLWQYPNARFHVQDIHALPLTVNTMATDGRSAMVFGDVNSDTYPDFFVSEYQDGETCKSFGFDVNNQVRNWFTLNGPPYSRLEACGVTTVEQSNDKGEILFSINTYGDPNETFTIINGKAELKQWVRKTPQFAGPPVVADLEGDGTMEIIVSTSDERILCLDAPRYNQGNLLKLRWRMRGQGMTNNALNRQDGVLVTDLDNDGTKEIVFAQEFSDGRASIVAVTPWGSIKWRRVFSGFDGSPPIWNLGGITYWLAGNFTSKHYQDLYVTIRRSKMHSDVGFLLNGRNGHVIWECDKIIIPGGNPAQDIRGHGGDRVACADMDNDGLDELICAYPDLIYIVDGRTGNPVAIRSTTGSLFSYVAAYYAVPVLMNLNADPAPEIFYGRCNYLTALLDKDCNVIWQHDYHPNADNGCNYLEGIGDCNHDGRLEIGQINKNAATGSYEFCFYYGDTGKQDGFNDQNVLDTNNPGKLKPQKYPADFKCDYINFLNFTSNRSRNQLFSDAKIRSAIKPLEIYGQGLNFGTVSLQGLGSPCTDMVTADLDRDGCDEFLFGIGTSLQCVGARGLKWGINTEGIPGEIALADVNMDGNLEIIVCTSDGFLKVYK